jgi:hypothetical protein
VQEFLLLFPVASAILNTILGGIANEIFWRFFGAYVYPSS